MKEASGWGSLAILSLLVLGIGATFSIPGLGCGSKMKSNGTAAIATLRNLASVQARFKTFGGCDLDGDGVGEYGTFGELTAAAGVRGDPLAGLRRAALREPLLSPAFAITDADGIVTKSGYAFRIFLPARGGGAVHEGRGGTLFARPVDTDGAEVSWCAYAWPVAGSVPERRVFFVTGTGESYEVWQTANGALGYVGSDRGPAWDGAFPAGTGNGWRAPKVGAKYAGRDGNEWWPVN